MESTLHVASHEEAMALFGPGDRNLRLLRDAFRVQLIGRGCTVRLVGEKPAVDQVAEMLHNMISLHRSGSGIPVDFVEREIEKVEKRTRAPRETGGGLSRDDGSSTGLLSPRPCSADLSAEERASIAGIARSRGQEAYLEALYKNDIVFCIGPAGTGKTFLAVRMAINLLRSDQVRRIVLCRPAVEAGEKLGFLPGDFQAKINPYLRPLYDALNDILDYDQIKRYLEREIIEVLPLAYMRGRTLNNACIILDEGQNTSIAQMKMFLTRMGMNSRIVVNGDVTQVDLPDGQLSGLIHAQRIIKDIRGIAWIQLEKVDIVRHPLVRRIVQAYEDAEPSPGGRP